MTIILAIALFILRQPVDGGNHPRKEEMKATTTMRQPSGFHPQKEVDA